uniref:CCR4-NOT transcription complex subunit 2 n=1 Tax=Myripristis murdjan TaxID=586833 RepID=A0A667XRG7_9TELE
MLFLDLYTFQNVKYARTHGRTFEECVWLLLQVTRGSMFGANRKKFVEGGVEGDYADDSSLYYSQQSMFPPHRMLASSSPSSTGQLSQLGASLYGPQSALGFPMRGMNSSAASQLGRTGLNQSASQLTSHVNTPNAGTMHTPPSPSRGILPMSSRSMLNHSQQVGGAGGQGGGGGGGGERGGGGGGGGGGRSGGMGSPSRSSPSIICMPKQQQARQPFTINSMSGFGMNRNPAFTMNNSLSSNIFNGTDGSENVTGLDLSDFPALADRSRRDAVTHPVSSNQNLNSSGKPSSNSDGPKFPGDKSSVAPSNNNQQKKGIQVLPDGRVTNIPVGMVTDQFGMIGLLTFIRAAETDPGMVHLALGSDLTTLGLNLNSPENLYPKFASPWASAPCRPQDIDFHVPSEYLTNIHIRDKLAAIKLSRYGEDLLFYLYYMNGGDLLQLLAAVELFNRDWRYHKEERVWITRAPGMEPTLKTNAYERGTYYFFDCLNWRKVAKEFHLEYDKLEERPHVPSTFNYNPAQQAF